MAKPLNHTKEYAKLIAQQAYAERRQAITSPMGDHEDLTILMSQYQRAAVARITRS